MKLRTTLAIAALALTPTLALAQGVTVDTARDGAAAGGAVVAPLARPSVEPLVRPSAPLSTFLLR